MEKRNEKPKGGKYLNAAGKARALRWSQWLALLKPALFAFAALIALVASTAAWFANNREVSSSDSSVTSSAPDTNLYIRLSGEEQTFLSKVEKSWQSALGLYPISTADCRNWYYVDGWALQQTNDAGAHTVTGTYTPGSYALAAADENGLYTNKGTQQRRAWFSTTYNLYTSGAKLDIYLNPDTPIRVTTGNTKLDQAIRVALVDGSGQPVLIYAPTAEDTFYAVTDTGVSEQTNIKVGNADLSDYTAGKGSEAYTPGTNKLCTANSGDGVDITVYVWLEGTDAQAEIGQSDSETTGITVSVNFVGVEASQL